MWPNRYWANYWADRYWPSGGEASPPPASGTSVNYVLGIGPMGKTRVHPAPSFNRVQQ